jgi:hypothetical protein
LPPLELVVDKAHENPLRRLHAKSNDCHLDERILSTGAVGPHLACGWYNLRLHGIAPVDRMDAYHHV